MARTSIERYYVAQQMKRPHKEITDKERLDLAREKIKALEENLTEARLLAEVYRDKLGLLLYTSYEASGEIIAYTKDVLPWED